jgi:phage gp46-like protein
MSKIDIKLTENSNGIYDVAIDPATGDLVNDPSFDTDIQFSLFTDRRADESQIQQPELRRGWFGDSFTTLDGYQAGSLIWLLDQARLTNETLSNARDFAYDALNWIIEKDYATRINITATPANNESIILRINIFVDNNLVSSNVYKIWKNSNYA